MTALNTLTYGTPGERRIVFCHGLFGQGRNWSTHGRALAEEGWFVALPDLPNHGRSSWTDDVDHAAMAQTVATELRRLAPDPTASWAVVGHSMGGKVAMRLALDHPDLVERLCVVDIAPVAQDGLSSFAGYVAAMQAIDLTRLTDRSEADAALTPQVTDPVVRAFLLQNLRRETAPGHDAGWRWQMNLDVLGRRLRRIGDWPAVEAPPYPGPVLWVAGAESDYIGPEDGPAMRALFPQTRLVRVKHAGHWVHSEQPAVFGSILRAFLRQR